MNVDRLVNATVSIRVGGEPVGTGFRFLTDGAVVTNEHVLPPSAPEIPLSAVTPAGKEVSLDLHETSNERGRSSHDYAILEATDSFGSEAAILQPSAETPSRTDTVWFSGYPFDVPEPLVHEATVSGPHPSGFFLDGSVNLGNSGGPIVAGESTEVVGIITESEMYEGESLEDTIDNLYGIEENLARIQEVHETTINRVDVEARAMDAIQEIKTAIDLLTDNVSSGVGVGYDIQPVKETISELEETEI